MKYSVPNSKVNISATRERVDGEITPLRAEHSADFVVDDESFAAGSAIDLLWETFSATVAGPDGKSWLKITLDKIYCVEKVIWYNGPKNLFLTWTCIEENCSDCEGPDECSLYTLVVISEKTEYDLPSISDCRYGDAVKVENTEGNAIAAFEIVIKGKEGNQQEH